MLDSRSRGCCFVSLSKTLYPLLSTCLKECKESKQTKVTIVGVIRPRYKYLDIFCIWACTCISSLEIGEQAINCYCNSEYFIIVRLRLHRYTTINVFMETTRKILPNFNCKNFLARKMSLHFIYIMILQFI